MVRLQSQQLSLWQSAVAAHVSDQLGAAASTADVLEHPMTDAVNAHVGAVAGASHPLAAPDPAAGPEVVRPYLSQLALDKGMALADGDTERAAAIDVEFRKYSDQDIKGFLSCATTYAEFLLKHDGKFKYNDWQKEGAGNINYGVIAWRLANDATVGVIGDWGTGLDDAEELLVDLMAKHSPDALIHLGDIYYSGTPDECAANYADVISRAFDRTLGQGKHVPVFTLAGNHDYYALGYGLYDMFGAINSRIPGAEQVATYFCLRTADDGWQFLAMDTGYNDSNPADQFDPLATGPSLVPSEQRWLLNKLDTFPGATVLLSHHQLFSANSRINGRTSKFKDIPYLNAHLREAFSPYLASDVAGWIWGHEHNFVAYQNGLFGLSKGRLLGNSAYEEESSMDPYAVNYPAVPYLDPTKYRLDAEAGYYNHGYAVIELGGRAKPADPVSITYYQYPSWGATRPADPSSSVILTEQFARPIPPIQSPVTFGTRLNLLASEGLFIGPFYSQIQYYPTAVAQGPVALTISGGSGTLHHGAQVQIKTTESGAGSYNLLGAWSTPTLYYYSSGYDQENWTVQKRDPSDPVVHYGEEICFVNKSYKGQSLQPYWSRVYGATYLTTQSAGYYWTARPA